MICLKRMRLLGLMIVDLVERVFTIEAFQCFGYVMRLWQWGRILGIINVMICSLLGAFMQSGWLMLGRRIHVYAPKEMGFEVDIIVATS